MRLTWVRRASRVCRIAALALIPLAIARGTLAQDRASGEAFARWVTAVRSHHPGTPDAAAASIVALKYSDRVRLNPAMQLFVAALRGESIPTRTDPQRQVAGLFRSIQDETGLAAFLRRAAVLHTDATAFETRFPAVRDDAPPASPPSGQVQTVTDRRTGMPFLRPAARAELIPPLLTNERQLLHTDGRVVGETKADWSWPFARSLLDVLLPAADHRGRASFATDADRAFVAEWYHAVAAYLLATGRHGDLKTHLDQAAQSLPGDARLLFDRACYAETLGLPYYQVLPGDAGFQEANRQKSFDLPGEDRTDADAEKLFRLALDAEPGYAEARVRLARLLERRGRLDEAAAELEKAFQIKADRTVTFYAHLVAGRVAQARGRYAESLDQYAAALKLYPDAQSALLGASQAALMTADVSAALTPLQHLGAAARTDVGDPWWLYQLGAGRDANALMAAVWGHVGKSSQQ